MSESPHNKYMVDCFYYYWVSPSNSNGREKDYESGFHYYGARYYWSELLTGWLSIDPMMDKYPGISPYNYCEWNPVVLVDPDGRDSWSVDENGNVMKTGDDGGKKKQTINYANGVTATLSGEHYQSLMSDLSGSKIVNLSTGEKCRLSSSEGGGDKKDAMSNLFLSLADNTNLEWSIQSYKDGEYSISTFHDSEKSPSPLTLGKKMSNLNAMIHSHPNADPNVRDEISSLGLWTTDGTHKTLWETRGYSDYGVRCNYPPNINYNVYMKKSHTIYSIGKGQWPKNNGKITKYSQLPW